MGESPDMDPGQPVLRWEDPREKRLRALRDLAANSSHPSAQPLADIPAAAPESLAPPKARTRRPRWLIAAIAALTCVAIITLMAVRVFSLGQPNSKTAVPSAMPGADGLTCPVDVRWSPRGDRIAVLGYSGSCPSAATPNNARASAALVLIYDARTMKVVKRLHPDDLILNSHILEDSSVSTNSALPPVIYRSITWSRDGTLLALPFDVISQQRTASLPVPDDVLLTDLNGVYDALTRNPLDAPATGVGMLWGMRQGGALSGTDIQIPPPALAYSWQQNNVLAAQRRLDLGQPIAASPLSPVGNPYADSTFTAWQPGFIFVLPPDVSNPNGPNIWKYYSTYGAETPDGQYLIAPTIHRFNVAPPGQPGGTDTNVPTLPLRDAALRAAFGAATASQNTGGAGAANVAWDPSGRVLAAQPIPAGDTTPAHHAVILYACATGKILATLTPVAHTTHPLSSPSSDAFDMLQWSPDGSHLLLLDPALGTLTVWGPPQLPR